MPARSDSALALFAVTAPGLEPLAAGELRALGLSPRAPEPGGVAFTGPLESAALANLWLRTASRVLVRLGEFHARALGELERRARTLPWARVLAREVPVQLRVTCHKSRLYHSGAVAERVAAAIIAAVPGARVVRGGATDEERDGEADVSASRPAQPPRGQSRSDEAPAGRAPTAEARSAVAPAAGVPPDAQLIIVRLLRDRCEVSADSSGALLHRRGYRLASGKAPIRETLAAAALLASAWDVAAPLLDPLCGAGTIPIEGALLARHIAPGLHRRFACMGWPEFDRARWERLVDAARAGERPAAPAPILGSDRDAGAIAAALANAERAGVAGDIAFDVRALSHVEPPPGAGWLVTNPPYGVRVGERDRLRDLYARLGQVAREHAPGWTLALISASPALERQLGVPLHELLRTRNGGIPVRVLRAAG